MRASQDPASIRLRRPRFLLALPAALAILLTGCLQMTHTLDILSDGGAIYTLSYAISEQAVTQFHEAAQIRDDLNRIGTPTPAPIQDPILLAFQNPTEKRIRQALQPAESEGLIRIEELEIENQNNWRNITLRLSCDNLAALATNSFFSSHGFSLTPQTDGSWVFWRAPHLSGARPAPPSTQTIRQATPLLEGFETKVDITVPGRITQTSARRTEQSTCRWEFSFNRDGGALIDLQYTPFRIVFTPTTGTTLSQLQYHGKSLLPSTPPPADDTSRQ